MGKNDFCCAHGCSNNRKRNPGLQFYRIPKDAPRRKAWLQRIRRKNFTPTNNTRICSEHFVGGVKSDDPQAQGFTPSIFKHTHGTSKTHRSSQNSSRYEAVENIDALHKPKRRKLSLRRGNEVRGRPKQSAPTIEEHKIWGDCLPLCHSLKQHDYCSAQVDPESLSVDKSLIDELSTLYKKVADLEEENNNLKARCLTLDSVKDDDKRFQCFTGFPNYATFKALFDYLNSVALQKKKNWRGSEMESKLLFDGRKGPKPKLTLEEEFFMVLIRLRCGLTLADLALRYNLSVSSVSRIFTTWINLLYFHLKELCQMPDYCDDFGKANHFSNFPDLKVIVDCTEIFTQKPSSLKANKQIYSNYKSHTTFKFLVAINKSVAIVYVSRGWGGRTSDKCITANSADFIATLEEGDEIMADRGFDIGDVLRDHGVKITIPDFKGQGRSQLKEEEGTRSEKIAEARIHVERAIQRIKMYRILDREVRLSMAHLAEQIFTVCAYLVNFQTPILQ